MVALTDNGLSNTGTVEWNPAQRTGACPVLASVHRDILIEIVLKRWPARCSTQARRRHLTQFNKRRKLWHLSWHRFTKFLIISARFISYDTGRVMTQLSLRPPPFRRAESNPMGSTRGICGRKTVSWDTGCLRSTSAFHRQYRFTTLHTHSLIYHQQAYKLQHFVLTQIQWRLYNTKPVLFLSFFLTDRVTESPLKLKVKVTL